MFRRKDHAHAVTLFLYDLHSEACMSIAPLKHGRDSQLPCRLERFQCPQWPCVDYVDLLRKFLQSTGDDAVVPCAAADAAHDTEWNAQSSPLQRRDYGDPLGHRARN